MNFSAGKYVVRFSECETCLPCHKHLGALFHRFMIERCGAHDTLNCCVPYSWRFPLVFGLGWSLSLALISLSAFLSSLSVCLSVSACLCHSLPILSSPEISAFRLRHQHFQTNSPSPFCMVQSEC